MPWLSVLILNLPLFGISPKWPVIRFMTGFILCPALLLVDVDHGRVSLDEM